MSSAPSPRAVPWLTLLAVAVIAPVAWAYAGLISSPHIRIGIPVHPSAAPVWSGSLADLPADIPEGSGCDWETDGAFLHAAGIDLGRVVHPSSMSFVISSDESYTLWLLRDGVAVNQLEPPRVPVPCQGTGMTRFEVLIPPSTRVVGFDTVVLAAEVVVDHCVGAFEFVEPGEPEPSAPPGEEPSGEEALEDQPPEEDG